MTEIEHSGTVCECQLPPDDHQKHVHACLEDCPLKESKHDYAVAVFVSVTGNMDLHSHACCLEHTLAPLEEMITIVRKHYGVEHPQERDRGQNG